MARSILSPLICLLLLSFCGCAGQSAGPSHIKDGEKYGQVQGAFRHRWWNYYERGLSFADGAFFSEAVKDLQEAIQQRTRDQRMARTYGMHFIDYFPHRELGIVYYETGRLEAAKKELEHSLSLFPSAKARFYLDRVRKRLIERMGEEVPPPRLTLKLKTDEIWTREDPVALSGVAEDEHYVAALSIRGVPRFLESSQERIPFEEPLYLSQGRHAVEVVAKNLLGKVKKRHIVIHVDRQGPIITLDDLNLDWVGPRKQLSVSGSIYDESGVSDLSINGQPWPIEQGVEVSFTARLTMDADTLALEARDRLGNLTSDTIPLALGPGAQRPVMLACADSEVEGSLLAGLFGPKDTRPPSIRLKGWTDTQAVFLERVYIEGQVIGESKIETLTINQKPILRREGRYIFFSHMAHLREGKNVLTIEARDEGGNTASKTMTVIRRIPSALQLAERWSLTAFPFQQKGAVSEASLAFQDNLIDALVNQNRFRVVERQKLDVILTEQKLSRTKLFDKRTAINLGRLATAQSVIMGSIIETRTGIEIVARMIDTETSEILASKDVYGEVKDLPALRSLAEGMAIKFHLDFPMVDGLVIEHKGKAIFTDLGDDVIKIGRRLIVYQEEPIRHPVTGKMCGADNKIIGRACITQVMSEMSKAELLECNPESVGHLDRVITQ